MFGKWTKRILKCETCKQKFEHFSHGNGRKKRFCEDCTRKKINNNANLYRLRKGGNKHGLPKESNKKGC